MLHDDPSRTMRQEREISRASAYYKAGGNIPPVRLEHRAWGAQKAVEMISVARLIPVPT